MNALIKKTLVSEAELFLQQYQPREVEGIKLGNKNTFAQYKRGLNKLFDYMVIKDITTIADLNLSTLTALQDEMLKEGFKAHTIAGYMRAIKGFFYFLQSKGILKNADFTNLRVISIDSRDVKTITLKENEINRIMSHLMALPDSPSYIVDKLIFIIMVNTGIREEEVTHIKIGDIVKQNKGLVINIHGKGMRKRFVALSPEVSQVVMSLRSKLENAIMSPLASDDYLIQSVAFNKPTKQIKAMHRTCIHDRIKKVSLEVGIDFTVHSLRRSFATILYKRNTPIEVIQRMLGHESPTTTQRYIDLDIDKEIGMKYATSMVG